MLNKNKVGLRFNTKNSSIDYTNGIFVMKSGNDANPGTYLSPVLTLDRANTISTTGKKIYVYAGEYVEDNATEHCWVVSKATTWRAIGNVTVKGTSGNNALVTKTAASTIIGFTIDGETRAYVTSTGVAGCTLKNCTIKNGLTGIRVTTSSQVIDGCTFDGQSGGASTASLLLEKGATITNCTFKNISARSLLYSIGHTNPVTFSGNTATENITGITSVFWLRSASTVVIDNNTITHTGAVLANFLLMNDTLASGSFTITNNLFAVNCATSAPIIQFGEASQVVTINFAGNTVDAKHASQTQDIIRIANKPDVVINSNYIKSVQTNSLITISVTSSGQDTTGTIIKNNIIENPATSNYIIRVGTETTGANDNKCADTIIENNWIYGKRYYTPAQATYDVHCIFVGHNTGAKIRYNHVYGGGLAIIVKSSGLTDPTAVIMYNVVTNAKEGIRLKGVPNVTIIGNTIYADNIDNHTGISLDDNLGGDNSSGATVKNNIVYTTSTVTTNILVYVKTGSQTDLDMDYNCLKADGAASYGAIAGTAYATHASLVAAGFNVNGQSNNPQFTSAAAYNFTLESDSPCLDSGETLDAALDDGQGYANASLSDVVTKQQAGIWDVGAYVY